MQRHLVAFIVFTFCTVASPFAAAQVDPSCQAKPVEDPNVKGRAKTVTFPDGRFVTLVGHIHGERQIYEIYEDLNSRKIQKMSDAEFESYLRKILNHNSLPTGSLLLTSDFDQAISTLKKLNVDTQSLAAGRAYTFSLADTSVLGQAKEDLAYLHELSTQNKIRFVGYEGSEDTLKNNIPALAGAFQILNREYQARKAHLSLSSKEFEDVLLSATNANGYAFIKDLSLWKRSPLFGVEDPNVLSQAKDDIDPVSDFEKAVQKLSQDDDQYASKLTLAQIEQQKTDKRLHEFGAILMHIISEGETMNLTSPELLEKEISMLQSLQPTWLAADVGEIVRLLRKRVQFTLARNAGTAKILTALHVSGVHYMGLDHFNDVIRNLELTCTREKTSGGAPLYYGNPQSAK